MKLKQLWYEYKRERIVSRLLDVQGIGWYCENDNKMDEILDLLYPLEDE